MNFYEILTSGSGDILRHVLSSYLELWQPLCSVDRNHLCHFGRIHHEEHILWIYFEFGPVVQEMNAV